jgi:hypothetical protein
LILVEGEIQMSKKGRVKRALTELVEAVSDLLGTAPNGKLLGMKVLGATSTLDICILSSNNPLSGQQNTAVPLQVSITASANVTLQYWYAGQTTVFTVPNVAPGTWNQLAPLQPQTLNFPAAGTTAVLMVRAYIIGGSPAASTDQIEVIGTN